MNDPYKLPDGPVAIQFSGGRTSGYMLKKILDRYDGVLPDNCHVLFQNTGREMPETLDFVHECQTQWNVPIIWLERGDNGEPVEVSHNSASRNGEPFESLIKKKKYVPNGIARFCTSDLKVIPSKKWMQSQGYEKWFAAIGFRADEPSRAERKSQDKMWENFYPLFLARVAQEDVQSWWIDQSFNLTIKSTFSNCDGCMLKSEKTRAHLARYYPDRAKWWDDMEKYIGGTFHKSRSWDSLISHAQRQEDWVFNEENDTYCDTGFGGCHD